MVIMTAGQWSALAEYLGHVEFYPGDRVRISGDETALRAEVVCRHGTVVDEVDVEADPSEGT